MMITSPDYYDLFRGYHRKIFTDICLRLIATTDIEKNLMINEPHDFVQLSSDACDDQRQPVIKSRAARLAIEMSYKIDGALSMQVLFLT